MLRIALLIVLAASQAFAQTQASAEAKPAPAAKPKEPPPPPIPPFPDPQDVVAAMKKAALYYRRNVSVVGGYAWKWPKDLSTSKGEDRESPTLISLQPPGTPAMGLAFLHAFKATGDVLFKQAAHEVAQALMWSQLASGGWDADYDFNPQRARKYHYRRDIEAGDTERGSRHASSTLDDQKTETALLFLLEMAHTKEFANDEELQRAVKFGFDGLLAAQAPNGAWGQHYDGPSDPSAPVKRAVMLKEWPHVWPGVDYTKFYTLNDNNIQETIRVLLHAYALTKDERYLASAKKAGDFFLLAQFPEPQPAWAQQYNHEMEPVWARKFEPPAVCTVETVGALEALHELWVATGDVKFLQPHKAVFAWLERSRLPDGRFARFYELGTNKPLYCKRGTYEVTFDDSDLPTHYGFKVEELQVKIDKLKEALAMSREDWQKKFAEPTEPKKWASRAKSAAEKVVKALKTQTKAGYWTSDDMISGYEFVSHFKSMSNYVEGARKGGDVFEKMRAKKNQEAETQRKLQATDEKRH